MNAAPHRRPALLVGALALAAVTAATPLAVAAEGDPVVPHHEQVVLVDGTDAQTTGVKSAINGTAQVASADGQRVAFSTRAKLVAEDTNRVHDVYLRDRSTGRTLLVSQRKGVVGNDLSFEPTISDDGRFVAYSTFSTNLARRSGSEALDVVVRDMESQRTVLVSQSTSGEPGTRNSFFPVLSGDGRFVAFQTFSPFGRRDLDRRADDVYLRDLEAGTTRQVSLLPGTDRDVRGGVVNGDVSDNGRLVTFGNSERLWLRDMRTGETLRFHQEDLDAGCQPIPGLASAGRPVISGDGRYVAFSSCSGELVGDDDVSEIFRLELASGKLERLTYGNQTSGLPSLSRDGRYVGFGSLASNLVAGDDEGQDDVFRLDTLTGELVRVSQDAAGEGGNGPSGIFGAAISSDGSTMVYASYADNLVAGDLSDYEEVFASVL